MEAWLLGLGAALLGILWLLLWNATGKRAPAVTLVRASEDEDAGSARRGLPRRGRGEEVALVVGLGVQMIHSAGKVWETGEEEGRRS